MSTRRDALRTNAQSGAALVLPQDALVEQDEQSGIEVNDLQSRLNPTRVHRIVAPRSIEAIQRALHDAEQQGRSVSIAGGRHSMGGQQFAEDAILLDMRQFNQVVRFDRGRGLIEVEGGIEWPDLIGYLHRVQARDAEQWGIREKQTGVDRVTVGGSLASNVHGKDLLPWVETRLRQGFVYGDCQYSTDLSTDPRSHMGVFSCYQPVDRRIPVPKDQRQLSPQDWAELYTLARTEKKKAFEKYSAYSLATSGQVYWSDMHQLAGNFEGYRGAVDEGCGTEMITEVYVPKDAFLSLLSKSRRDFLHHNVDVTYGTIRFIEKDTESFLAWAREPSVCIVCNLHVVHTAEGRKKAAADFRRIIDRAIEHRGTYFLTYHRWATRQQVETCYPQFAEFLRLKRKYDPRERFQSDRYRHYKAMFADRL